MILENMPNNNSFSWSYDSIFRTETSIGKLSRGIYAGCSPYNERVVEWNLLRYCTRFFVYRTKFIKNSLSFVSGKPFTVIWRLSLRAALSALEGIINQVLLCIRNEDRNVHKRANFLNNGAPFLYKKWWPASWKVRVIVFLKSLIWISFCITCLFLAATG